MAENMPDRGKPIRTASRDVLFFLLGLLLGVPLFFFGLKYASDHFTTITTVTICTIVVLCLLGLIISLFKDRIIKRIYNVASTEIESFGKPLQGFVTSLVNQDKDIALEHSDDFLRRFLARYSWVTTRRWILATILSVLIAFTGFAGSALLYEQNSLLESQNEKLDAQTGLLNQQNMLAEASRRSALIFELTDILNELDEEIDLAEIETTAAISAELDRGTMQRSDYKNDDTNDSNLRPHHNRRSIGTPRKLFRVSGRLTGRIVALSRALRPYTYLDSDGNEIPEPLSPERGQLLLSLVYSGVDMEDINHEVPWFYQADLEGANLSKQDLTHTKLQGANLKDADLSGAILEYVRLDNADLRGTNLFEAKGLSIHNFMKGDQPIAVWDETTKFPEDLEKQVPAASGETEVQND